MNIFQKATASQSLDEPGKFERFNLLENPFPAEPVVNQEAADKRLNGALYENAIRLAEHELFMSNFVLQPRSNPNHLRLGFLVDKSYIGRGNGKSAFLVNVANEINRSYCLDISNSVNKCFAVSVIPESGGRSRTFGSIVDLVFEATLRSPALDDALAIIRFQALSSIAPSVVQELQQLAQDDAVIALNNPDWLKGRGVDLQNLARHIVALPELSTLPKESPVFSSAGTLFECFVTSEDFVDYYKSLSPRGNLRSNFLFNELVMIFCAAGFNGAFVFIDDFERIPSFQNARQKKDFALELRTALYDGLSANAKIGFFTWLLVLHAGVHRLIGEAWADSGMENRAPIEPRTESSHFIEFQPLNREYAILLVKRYLKEYRITSEADELRPFTAESITHIGEISEYNAARILKTCYALLEQAVKEEGRNVIDLDCVLQSKGAEQGPLRPAESIVERESVDLTSEILQGE